MSKLEIRIKSLENSVNKFKNVFKKLSKGEKVEKEEYIAFSSVEELNKILTKKRLDLLKFIKQNDISSVKELADKVDRNYKNVYTNLKLLEQLGIVELKEEKGKIRPIVLYDELDIKIPLTTSKSP